MSFNPNFGINWDEDYKNAAIVVIYQNVGIVSLLTTLKIINI